MSRRTVLFLATAWLLLASTPWSAPTPTDAPPVSSPAAGPQIDPGGGG